MPAATVHSRPNDRTKKKEKSLGPDPKVINATWDSLKEAFHPAPPADLPERAREHLRHLARTEGKLDAPTWRARIDAILEEYQEWRRNPKVSVLPFDGYVKTNIPADARPQLLAAHETALWLFLEERKAGRHTTLVDCKRAAARACRLPQNP